MTRNDTYYIKEYFIKYIDEEDIVEKQNIIKKLNNKIRNQGVVINNLKNIVDSLNVSSQRSFINSVCNVSDDILDTSLIRNIESQLNNRTTSNNVIKKDVFTIEYMDGFKKENKTKEYEYTSTSIFENGSIRELTRVSENSSYFYNYIVEKFLYKDIEEVMIARKDYDNYIITNRTIPDISNSKISKEDSLCNTRDIQYFIDKFVDGKDNKDKYLKMIFMDVITNQNFRILSEGFGIIDSDNTQNDYYVLNGMTLKKDVVIDSFLRNYLDSIVDITNKIVDNYDDIMNFISYLIDLNEIKNTQYLLHLRDNIVKIYEKIKIQNSLNAIEFGEDEIIDDIRKNNDSDFKRNLNTFCDSLNLSGKKLTKKGYTSVFFIVGSIVISGIVLAHLLLSM